MVIVICLGVLLVLLGLFLPSEIWCFDEKAHPRISDKEFLALCKPGTDPRIALKVREIVAEQAGTDPEMIRPDTRFVEDLGFD